MVGWHHQLDGHGFGWTPGVGDGQGGLACCDSWGCKASDTTERLNFTELNINLLFLVECHCVILDQKIKPTIYKREVGSCRIIESS